MTAANLWDQVLARIETKVNRHSYYTWFKPITFVRETGSALVLRVPNELLKTWLIKHYAALITDAVNEVRPGGLAVTIVTEGEPDTPAILEHAADEPTGEPPPVAARAPYSSQPLSSLRGLNPRYTFNSFIVGSSNQFAHAACRAVAEAPSRSYNPLFIYGGVGLGKTHLMHAIGHYVLHHDPSVERLTYISSERFMNEMINALKNDRIIEFRERYRSVDVFLVDDIQFLSGKEGTQTEFFHTFNALFEAQKQIVISSDCPPHQITSLEERLRSRFEWGLIADIQLPDLETKVAILKKKAENEAVPLPDAVALYIAGKIKSNVRELEGSLIRLVAYASLRGLEITLALAQDVLKDILDHGERAITIEIVQKYVADAYQLKVSELRARNNSKSVALPRQIAMFMCKALTQASLPEIGKSFGGKHHSTVIHSIRKVERMRKTDGDFNTHINSMLRAFR